jgi:4'-phosphopantetheinyl transferase
MTEKSRIIRLTRDEIHLWLAFYDEITDVHLHSAYRELLNTEEKHQEKRFYFERDQRRYLITRALVRTVLSRYEPVHPREWIFSRNAYGRPEVANAPAKDSGLLFNISHTHSLIVLGVTRSRALGVDVENFRAREVSMDIADRYFAPQEVTALNTVPPHQQQYRHDRAVEISIDPELADPAGRWQLWQFRPTPEYLVAICAERVGVQSPSLVVRRAIPMLSEKDFAPEFLRVSA